MAAWDLLTFLLNEVADLLCRVDVEKTSVSSLDKMGIVRHAHAVLPVVCIGVSQLVELAVRLIGYVEHALILSEHLIFLEADSR